MKLIRYIEFKSGWRPPAYHKIEIRRLSQVGTGLSKNLNPYIIYLGEISDEDAIYIALMDQNARISNIPGK